MSALCDTMSASLTSLAPVARAHVGLAGRGRVPRGSRLRPPAALALVGAGSCLLARSFVGGSLGVSTGTGRGSRLPALALVGAGSCLLARSFVGGSLGVSTGMGQGSCLLALALVGAGSCLLAHIFVGGSLGVSTGTGQGDRVASAVFGGWSSGRVTPIPEAPASDAKHFLIGNPMYPPGPAGMEETGDRVASAVFGDRSPGRVTPIPEAPASDAKHFLTGNPMYPPWPAGTEEAMFGMGCFWCSENLYMAKEGIYSSQVGYAGGDINNPSYQDVCTGMSGHNEVVRIVYDPKVITYGDLLKVFWEKHDPTTKNQQGGDRGTQYRSGIYYYSEAQRQLAETTRDKYQDELEATKAASGRQISTEIVPAPTFFYGEGYHQQYDAKPGSRRYCGLSPTGAKLPA
mmetsp:Transcript_174489/g.553906  ORF Transcript_174489/g.553906 Transcript_174489/m.553906 type:complete len:402 (+) Transcript_174489:35-1240(+)